MNTCIGYFNQIDFCCFLLYSILGSIHALLMICPCIYRVLFVPYYPYTWQPNQPIIRFTWLSLLASILSIGLAIGVILAVCRKWCDLSVDFVFWFVRLDFCWLFNWEISYTIKQQLSFGFYDEFIVEIHRLSIRTMLVSNKIVFSYSNLSIPILFGLYELIVIRMHSYVNISSRNSKVNLTENKEVC